MMTVSQMSHIAEGNIFVRLVPRSAVLLEALVVDHSDAHTSLTKAKHFYDVCSAYNTCDKIRYNTTQKTCTYARRHANTCNSVN